MSEWIKCSDKNPRDIFEHHEPCPDVLVYHSWGIEVGIQFQCGEWVDKHLNSIKGVTHWMPLPKEPKDENVNSKIPKC